MTTHQPVTNPIEPIKAVIADDEPALLDFLRLKIKNAWPALNICGEAQDGQQALALIERHNPQVAFLDIRMPGMSGLEVARRIVDSDCRVVFVTAYDHYAVNAFESEAIDYLLKPVSEQRLAKTVRRLQKEMQKRAAAKTDAGGGQIDQTAVKESLARVLNALDTDRKRPHLQWIKAQQGQTVRFIPVAEVCYFQSGDKYTQVLTKSSEALIKKSIASLAEELDPAQFQRIHRGTIVNLNQIESVSRSISGRSIVKLKDLPQPLTASRSYANLFKQM